MSDTLAALRRHYAELGGAPDADAYRDLVPKGYLQVPSNLRFDSPHFLVEPNVAPSDDPQNWSTSFPERERLRQQLETLQKTELEARQRYRNADTYDERTKAFDEWIALVHQLTEAYTTLPHFPMTPKEREAQTQADADAMMRGVEQPKTGPMRGRLYTLPQYNQLGQIRPFGPGEYVDRGEGLWSSEETRTVEYGDGYAVVPGLWLVNGKPMMVDDAQAAQYAQQSKLSWPTFPTVKEAEDFATQREEKWQTVPIGRSDLQQPLWSRTWPPE